MKRGMIKSMVLIAWLGAGTAAACSIFNEFNIEEDDEELCKDYKDNDSDGLKDCLDPECAGFAHCEEGPHLDDDYEGNDNFCFDGIDQGADGIMDCFAEACRDVPECVEDGDECMDGIDNNRNGLVDCKEESCTSHEYCMEDSWVSCHDGIDNDADGSYDCEDSGCGEQGFCSDKDLEWCGDEIDNDGDTLADCTDPDCSRILGDGCDPEVYSRKILEEEFDSGLNEWLVYEFDPELFDRMYTVYETTTDGKLHVNVASQEVTDLFRVEYGAASRQRFFLWNNITDIVFGMRVTPPTDPFQPPVPAAMGLSIDATGYRPFVDKGDGGAEFTEGRHSMLMLRVDGFGGIQLCYRKMQDTPMTCFPESDPLPPVVEIPEGDFARYRLYINDAVIVVYQNDVRRLEVPNPFLPGVARLFFFSSTAMPFSMGASELFVDYAYLYQAYRFDAEAQEVPPEVSLAYTTWMEPERELLTNNPENCHYAATGEIAATWLQNSPEKCSVHFDENFAQRRVQVQYDFLLSYADFSARYTPGLWNPLMDYDSGLPLAAGLIYGDQFVFFPCTRAAVFSEDEISPPLGTAINVIMGYDPDSSFSYAVLMDSASDRDFWSFGSYTTTCYELTDFGISSMFCTECVPARAEGIITDIAISKFD